MRDIERHGFTKILKKFVRDRIFDRKSFIVFKKDISKHTEIYKKNFNEKKKWDIRILRTDDDIREVGGHFHFKQKHWSSLLSQGCECVACVIDGEMVGYSWYTETDFADPITTHKFVLHDSEVFQFEGFILPKYRGRSIPRDVLKHAYEYYYSKGYRKVVCVVDKEEKINIRLHKKLDFREVGTVIHFGKILNWRHPW